MRRSVGVVAAAAVCLCQSAMAADVGSPVGRPLTRSWAGFYVGGHGGGVWSSSGYTFDNGSGTLENFGSDPGSWLFGAHVGLQGQWGNVVLGLEGAYDWTGLSSTETSVLFAGRTRSLDADNIASVVGKVGYVSGNWMPYVKGGWAMADIRTFALNPATGTRAEGTNWEGGWTVGGGVDFMFAPFSPVLILGVDFSYSAFDFNRSIVSSSGASTAVWSNSSWDFYALTVRLSYLFN